MVQYHPPSGRTTCIDIGGHDWRLLRWIILYADMFNHAVNGSERIGNRAQGGYLYAESRAAIEYPAPCLTHAGIARQTRTTGMNADDFFIFGPYQHHGLKIGLLQCFVKGGLGIQRR